MHDIPVNDTTSSSSFFSLLENRVEEIDSLLCVGLDPHLSQLDLSKYTGMYRELTIVMKTVYYRYDKHKMLYGIYKCVPYQDKNIAILSIHISHPHISSNCSYKHTFYIYPYVHIYKYLYIHISITMRFRWGTIFINFYQLYLS